MRGPLGTAQSTALTFGLARLIPRPLVSYGFSTVIAVPLLSPSGSWLSTGWYGSDA